jgi:5-methylcytosine-specific restriction endonuclease McrA
VTNRKPIPGKLRLQVLSAAGYACAYCGGAAKEADHVIPFKHDGPTEIANLVACCVRCNRTAKGRPFASFEDKKAWINLKRAGQAPADPPPPPKPVFVTSLTSVLRRKSIARQGC